ncbi:MAG: hypothetical protein Q8S09_14890 [Hyphomonas sp.]|nr:hypothetical protein [Hyphomonas sp.]
MPDANQGGGFAYAFVSFVIGFAILAWPFFEAAQFGYGGGAIIGMLVIAAPAAGGFFVLTVVIASVTVILREIRQAAFEAALRAGEVESRAR